MHYSGYCLQEGKTLICILIRIYFLTMKADNSYTSTTVGIVCKKERP